jgi:prevent-host-death family protein
MSHVNRITFTWPTAVRVWLRSGSTGGYNEEMAVTAVGIRELRDGLSRHLADVRAGRTVTVTDHGRPIARIVPVDQPDLLQELIAEGVVRPAVQQERTRPEPVRATGSVSELVADERG